MGLVWLVIYVSLEMKSIAIQVFPSTNVLQLLSDSFAIPLANDTLDLPASLGEGSIRGWSFPGELRLYRFRFRLRISLEIVTLNPHEDGLLTLFIPLSENAPVHRAEGQTFDNMYSGNGIVFLSSPATSTHCPGGIWFDFLVISFTKATLGWYEQLERSVAAFLQEQAHVFAELTPEMNHRLKEMLHAIDQPDARHSLYLHSAALRMVYDFLQMTGDHRQPVRIRQEDFVRMVGIRNIMKSNLQQVPTIPSLARQAGCSESKLKWQFKEVFGKSMYQYFQYLRMLEAQRLFLTGHFNISQVAQRVGYQNLTHFSKAFEKHCGQKPSQFLKNNVSGHNFT